jgi:hypothetical protein
MFFPTNILSSSKCKIKHTIIIIPPNPQHINFINGQQQKTHSIESYKEYYFTRIAGIKNLIINLNKKKPKLVDNDKPSPKKIRGVRHNFATFHSLTSTTIQQK